MEESKIKPILYLISTSSTDVRLRKFLKFFVNRRIRVTFWGWDRKNINHVEAGVNTHYLLHNGTNSKKQTLLYYFLWMIKLFFKLLFKRDLRNYNIIAIHFESGFPILLVSLLRNIRYFYEVYDELSLSVNYPDVIKGIIRFVDRMIMKRAVKIIHVDQNRCLYNKENCIVIENTPYDFFKGGERDYSDLEKMFAVVGYFSPTRGLDQIYKFASKNRHYKFILVGNFVNNDEIEQKFDKLDNIIKYEFMSQEQLFGLMKKCCAIFSLYEPSLEINKLAASNKVYDAMMLGVPVITNHEVLNSKYIQENRIGFVVNYTCDESWNVLEEDNILEKCKEIGKNGREIYLLKYRFENLIEHNLMPVLFRNNG